MSMRSIRRFIVNNTVVTIAAGGYVITNEDVLIVNKTSGAATAVTLPATPATGQVVTVKDGKGDAATNAITISPAAGTIDGAATVVLSTNYGSVTLVYNGTEWGRSGGGSTASVASLTNSGTETDTPGASTAAAGTTTADAGVLPAGTSKVYPTTAADDTKGVRVHASDKVTGRMLFIGNGVANKILKVYAPSGGTINGGSADAAFSSVSGKGVVIVCLSSAGNTWLGF